MAAVHCSGAAELELLDVARRAGAHTGAFHPLQMFGDPDVAAAGLQRCAVAIEAAIRVPPAALVAESTFTSARDMARRHYPFVPSGLVRVGYDSLSRVRRLACPKLFLHGPVDTIVPFEMGEALFRAASEPKRLATLVGDHNSGGILESPDACQTLAEFLDAALGVAPAGSTREQRGPTIPAPAPNRP